MYGLLFVTSGIAEATGSRPGAEEQARWLQRRLREATFRKVFTSPLQRARRTCEVAGYASVAELVAICLNGTTATTKERSDPRSWRRGPAGSSFADTAVLMGNHRRMSALAQIACFLRFDGSTAWYRAFNLAG